MTGQMAASIRSRLGVTQCDLAAYLGCSERTIRRIERGETIPLPIFQRLLCQRAATAALSAAQPSVKTYRINAASMWRYLGKTGGWQRWTWGERGRWLRWKRFYERVRQEEQLGLARVEYTLHRRDYQRPQPAADLLASAPDLDV